MPVEGGEERAPGASQESSGLVKNYFFFHYAFNTLALYTLQTDLVARWLTPPQMFLLIFLSAQTNTHQI